MFFELFEFYRTAIIIINTFSSTDAKNVVQYRCCPVIMIDFPFGVGDRSKIARYDFTVDKVDNAYSVVAFDTYENISQFRFEAGVRTHGIYIVDTKRHCRFLLTVGYKVDCTHGEKHYRNGNRLDFRDIRFKVTHKYGIIIFIRVLLSAVVGLLPGAAGGGTNIVWSGCSGEQPYKLVNLLLRERVSARRGRGC